MARISRKWQIEEITIITKKHKCARYARISKETLKLLNSIDKQISICESLIEKIVILKSMTAMLIEILEDIFLTDLP